MRFAARLLDAWYTPRLTPLAALLLPLSFGFRAAVAMRRWAYRAGFLTIKRMPVPVIVIGNITVGGSGKTPMTVGLAQALQQRGWYPGIVSRGYGGSYGHPQAVTAVDQAQVVGDEPLLLLSAGCPVWVGRDRAAAAAALLARHPDCDVLLCDDGLQHYALDRTIEIAMIDGKRGMGNGHLLPAGPLREPVSRLEEVDMVVELCSKAQVASSPKHRKVYLEPQPMVSLQHPDSAAELSRLTSGEVHAIAGIGHPDRFFDTLRALGFEPICHPFADHHVFTPGDLDYPTATVIAMTEKDAVKCKPFADSRCWMLPVRAVIGAEVLDDIEEKLRGPKTA